MTDQFEDELDTFPRSFRLATLSRLGTLILVRHGQTTLNYNKTFTGWIDADLSEVGKREVKLNLSG